MAVIPADLGNLERDVSEIRLAQIAAERDAAERAATATVWFRLITIGLYAGLAANLMLAFAILLLVLVRP